MVCFFATELLAFGHETLTTTSELASLAYLVHGEGSGGTEYLYQDRQGSVIGASGMGWLEP